MRCHYEVLGLLQNATADDIKKAYRKCALQWHPDKHPDNKEEANKRFLEISDAYETLSNDQERAWYDSHREVLINGGTPGDPNDANYTFNVYPFFTSSCFRGFGDDEKGFYTVYREMFAHIADEDRQYYDEETDIPEFGYSDSDYETVVGPFYSFWLGYCTPRSFVWCEKHDSREANDRYVRRIMEKENKKVRDKAKKERNEEIRKIVEFVRKKDKRVEQYKKILEEKSALAQKKAKEKKEADRLKRAEQMNSYVEPSWSSVNHKLDELDLEEEKRDKKSKKFSILQEDDDKLDQGDLNDESGNQKEESDGENDSEEYDDSLFCVACDKSFKSAKSFENHEKSKKHKDNIELLKKHMKEEDMNLFFDRSKDNSNGVDQNSQDDIKKESNETKQKLSKKQKKRRKNNKKDILELEDENSDSATDENKPQGDEISPELNASQSNISNEEANVEHVLQCEENLETKQKETDPKPSICKVCNEVFPSRTKLFEHISKEGHAATKLVEPSTSQPLSHNAMKKNKRLAKLKK